MHRTHPHFDSLRFHHLPYPGRRADPTLVILSRRDRRDWLGNFHINPDSHDQRIDLSGRIWDIGRFGAFVFNLGFYLWLIDGWIRDSLRSAGA
ncbi:alkaline ceramidase family protein [Penicillium chermesinum]|uniref:Alkaline ceramidase family protein n=1 Tax=Penicillium chermesinum TaxID=63820 RepID=A0A9W9TT26_9EURO|nr:alkaline ceramidase family protein [Penicillium chermesinum]KAJ5239693.1 alkaline ceramidase family protein [Penicillium chermesinum]